MYVCIYIYTCLETWLSRTTEHPSTACACAARTQSKNVMEPALLAVPTCPCVCVYARVCLQKSAHTGTHRAKTRSIKRNQERARAPRANPRRRRRRHATVAKAIVATARAYSACAACCVGVFWQMRPLQQGQRRKDRKTKGRGGAGGRRQDG